MLIMRFTPNKIFTLTLIAIISMLIVFISGCGSSEEKSNGDNSDDNSKSALYDKDNPLVLKYNEQNAQGTPKAILAEDFSELVEQETEGRVKVETYLGGSAADYGIDSVMSGLVDFNQMVPSNVTDLAESISVLDAPYLFENMEHFLKAVDPESEVMGIFNDELSKQGVRVIMVAPSGERHITTTKKPIKTLEDMKGLKIRVVPSDVYSDTMKALGASPSPMPFSEVATSLTTGTLDGQENPFAQIVPNGLHEIQDNIILTGHIFSSGAVFMNNDQFEKLTEEDQKLLLKAGREAVEKNVELIQNYEEEWIEEAKSTSTIISEEDGLKLEEFRKATEEVHEKYKDDWGEAYEKILELK